LIICFICIVGMDMCDDMMSGIYSHLAEEIELSGFAWFYRYPGIRICGAIVSFVGSILALCAICLVWFLNP
jgi:hypothetical protein